MSGGSNAYLAWLMMGLGWTLALTAGGRLAVGHPAETVSLRDWRRANLKLPWPDGVVDLVSIVLLASGGSTLTGPDGGLWLALVALAGTLLLRFLPVVGHNYLVLRRENASSSAESP